MKSYARVECRRGKELITRGGMEIWSDNHDFDKDKQSVRAALIKRLNPVESRFLYEWQGDWEWVYHRNALLSQDRGGHCIGG